jgi:hypothetical protein
MNEIVRINCLVKTELFSYAQGRELGARKTPPSPDVVAIHPVAVATLPGHYLTGVFATGAKMEDAPQGHAQTLEQYEVQDSLL